ADERRTAVFGAAAVALAVGAGWWDGIRGDASYWAWVTVVCAVSAMAVVLAGVRRRREERLARMTAVAEAAQLALLPPLPPEVTGITIAVRYRSATREASVGGDLYEIIPTGHGIRVIIGDVRGKGLDAVLLARQVLSAFRRSAVAMPALEHVAGEVGRAIAPHLGAEDFVTAALAQIAPGGELTIVNCGHHPPLLRHRGALQPPCPEQTSVTWPRSDSAERGRLTQLWPDSAVLVGLSHRSITARPEHVFGDQVTGPASLIGVSGARETGYPAEQSARIPGGG